MLIASQGTDKFSCRKLYCKSIFFKVKTPINFFLKKPKIYKIKIHGGFVMSREKVFKLKMASWFVMLCILLVIVIGSVVSCSPNVEKNAKSTAIGNADVAETDQVGFTVEEILEALDDYKTLRADNIYNDKHVEIKGVIGSIDRSSNFFSLQSISMGDLPPLDILRCKIEEKHQKAFDNLVEGQEVTISGTVKSVGTRGTAYMLQIESLK